MVTNGSAILPTNIAEAMEKYPVVLGRNDGAHAVDCALAPFAGCSRKVVPDRFVAILRDGTPIGTCPQWQAHTTAVRKAGRGSEVQQLFTWIIGTFQAANPDRTRAANDEHPDAGTDLRPNKVVSYLKAEPEIVDLAEYKPTYKAGSKVLVTGFAKKA